MEGIQLSPCQQPDGNMEAEDHLLLVLLLLLLFLFKTATSEDPDSHLPDIFSETLCWPAKPYGSVLPLRIPLMKFLFLKDRVGKWEQSREKREGSLVPQDLWAPRQPWALVGMPALGNAGQIQRLSGGWATRRLCGLGIGSAHHCSQKTSLTWVHLYCSLVAVCITQQEPWMMKEPRRTLELFSLDRKRFWGKSVMRGEDK